MSHTSGLRDFPVTWRHLRTGFYDGHRGFFPTIKELVQIGRIVSSSSVIAEEVILHPLPQQGSELRDWLQENCAQSYTMAGRFEWLQHAYTVDRAFHGVVFTFNDFNMAVLFKLFWAGSN